MRRTLTGPCVLLSLVLPLTALALNAGLGEPPPMVDRQSPYAAAKGFSDAVHRGEYTLASHYLDLDFIPPAEQKAKGAQLSRRLKFILDRKLPGALGDISKEPEGDPALRRDRLHSRGRGSLPHPARPRGGRRWAGVGVQRSDGAGD